jgi:DNA-binding IclR family transcriptional regulator
MLDIGCYRGPVDRPQPTVPAAERTLDLLELLAAAPRGLTTSELLDEVESSRSGLYALLNTLKARGYVVTEDGRHRSGPAVWNLVPGRPQELETLLAAFREERDFDESVALVWPERGGTVVVAESQPERSVRAVYRHGAFRPLSSPDARVIAAGGAGDDPDLRRVRREAAATASSDEITEIAVPICADGIRPVAALVAGIPAQRASGDHLEEVDRTLRQAAARLSYRLGAPVYQPYGWAPTAPIGPSRELSSDEIDEFLSGLWGAQLACVRADGTPHVVPLWYEWDGEVMWVAASPGASWRSYVAETPQVSVTLDEPWSPLRRVFLTGRAEEVDEESVEGGLQGLRRRLAVRYLGQGAERQPELSETEGWAAIRIVPERILGRQGLGPVPVGEAS